MKFEEKKQAISLRKKGMAMGEIAKKINVSKSSVSYWVRDIRLTPAQKNILNKNGHSVSSIEKRRISRLANTKERHKIIYNAAFEEAKTLRNNILWSVGVALYWGEGGKSQNLVRLSNSDPDVIATMMKFFKQICKVPPEKFRGHVNAFAHSNVTETEKYWSGISGIPRKQFFKTYQKNSSASLHKRDTLPNGTLQIYVLDTNLYFRIVGWMDYLKQIKNYD
jgi:transposase